MISVKKLATIGAAAALLASTAVPAFATGNWHWSDDDLVVSQSNSANITNKVLANSNTGNQSIGGSSMSYQYSGDGYDGRSKKKGNFALGTGDADTWVGITNVANSNEADVEGCDCFDDVTIGQGNNAYITNGVIANANTGNQSLGKSSNKAIHTGDAYTGVAVSNLVNSNVVKVH